MSEKKEEKILLVDDQESVRTMLSRVLKYHNFATYTADGGKMALEMMAEERFDVVVTDYKMPGMNGMELIEKIKELYPETEVLIMTAYASVDGVVSALRAGAFDFLLKPFNLELVLSSVQRALQKKRLEEQLKNYQESLEEMVEQRTAEIHKLNQKLEHRIATEVAKSREKDHLILRQYRYAAMGEMMSNIAHQWRQPLAALGLIIDDIKDAFRFGELDEQYIDLCVQNSRQITSQLSKTIDEFRTFFKSDSNQHHFSLNQSIKKVLSLVESTLEDKEIKLELNLSEEISIYGYPGDFEQALMNIVDNSRDALLSRWVSFPGILISCRKSDKKVSIFVRDNAGGVDEEIAHKIFEPYFTTKDQGKGIGVGLYMAKTVIEKNMNGRLDFCNTEEGAEFRIDLPFSVLTSTLDKAENKYKLRDDLTGLLSSQGFFNICTKQLEIVEQLEGKPLLMVMRLDNVASKETMELAELEKLAICEASKIFKECLRRTDFIARLDGFRFAALIAEPLACGDEIITHRMEARLKDLQEDQTNRCKFDLKLGFIHYDPVQPSSVSNMITIVEDRWNTTK